MPCLSSASFKAFRLRSLLPDMLSSVPRPLVRTSNKHLLHLLLPRLQFPFLGAIRGCCIISKSFPRPLSLDLSRLQRFSRIRPSFVCNFSINSPKRNLTSKKMGSSSHVTNGDHKKSFKYAAFKVRGSSTPQIGSLDLETGTITPLTYKSGTSIRSLYEVVESKDDVVGADETISVDQVELLPPISGRDILAVGKNYAVSVSQLTTTTKQYLTKNYAGACEGIQRIRI